MNWKTEIMIMGTAVGALIGFGTAFLLARTAERENRESLPEVSPGEALGVAVAIIGVVRGITALGDGKSKKK